MKLPPLINWGLVREPYNWAAIVLMCAFALAFLALVFPQPARDKSA